MFDHPTVQQSNLAKRQLGEVRQRGLEWERQKFEENKTRKRRDACSHWSAEEWQAAWEASRAGVIQHEPKFPIIITAFMTPQKVQGLAGLSSLPQTNGRSPQDLQIKNLTIQKNYSILLLMDMLNLIAWKRAPQGRRFVSGLRAKKELPGEDIQRRKEPKT